MLLVVLASVFLCNAKVFVSLTFDDTLVEHSALAKVLESYGMKGVFYMNSGRITGNEKRYLRLPQALEIQNAGHEIGGHTITHANLTDLTPEDQYAEICGDVANFTKMGIDVSSFAIPYGQYNNYSLAYGKECGYKSFRRSGGIGCPACPAATQYRVCIGCPPGIVIPFTSENVLYPLRSMSFRTNFVDLFLQTMEYARERSARRNTFLWLIFIFHDDDNNPEFGDTNSTISLSQLTTILDWIQLNNDEVATATIKDVISANGTDYNLLFSANQVPNATTATPPTTTVTTTPAALGGLGVGGAVGVAIGGFLLLAAIPVSAFVISKRRKTLRIAENAAVEV